MSGAFTLRRLVISVLLAIAGGLLVIAFQEAEDPKTTVSVRPAQVVAVFPAEGARVLRQERVGAQLADGYTGELDIDGTPLPLDQLVRPQDPIGPNGGAAVARGLAGLNEVFFTPGPGKDIERLRPGDHTARILFWDRTTGARERAETYTWRFAVT